MQESEIIEQDDKNIDELESAGNELEEKKQTKVVKYSVTLAQIARLEEKYAVVPEDLSNKKDYKLVSEAASHLRGLRTSVEKRRKELKSESLAYGKLVDSTAKEITGKLLAIEEPFATAKKDFDTAIELAKREAALAEEKRVDGIAERIAGIKALPATHISSTSDVIETLFPSLNSDLTTVDVWAMEFLDKAREAIADTMHKLEDLHDMKHQQETFAAQQAEAEAKLVAELEEARAKREAELEADRIRLVAERESMEAQMAELRKAAGELAKINAAKEAEREAEAEKERSRLAHEQAESDAVIAAEVDRIQRTADADRAKLQAEIAALKAVPAPEQVVEEAPVEVLNDVEPYDKKYRAAGQAMIRFTGNRAITKALLDAIIANEIPNVIFNK